MGFWMPILLIISKKGFDGSAEIQRKCAYKGETEHQWKEYKRSEPKPDALLKSRAFIKFYNSNPK
jgi:hypothetical protein